MHIDLFVYTGMIDYYTTAEHVSLVLHPTMLREYGHNKILSSIINNIILSNKVHINNFRNKILYNKRKRVVYD